MKDKYIIVGVSGASGLIYAIRLDNDSALEVLSQNQMANEPASGSFVHSDMVVARTLDHLNIEHELMPRWSA